MSARLPWAAIGLGLLMLGALFYQEVSSAVSVWSSSTAYGHCFLVLPIALWLLWERRDVFAALAPRPAWWPALLAVPLIVMWLAAYWLGIMEGRQLAAMGFVEILLLAGLGWRLWWALSAGFLYLFFLVPFGAFLTPMLQHFTAGFIVNGLLVLKIPFEANSFQITIPEGSFYVAEACAGLRFLIAAIAFGVLYAVTMFRSPWRRTAFIAISCVVPVLANGVRGLGIVVLGHILGSAQAGAADHLIYGWVFFSAVILLLAAGGFAFLEAPAPAPMPELSAPVSVSRLAGCALIVVLAACAPAASSAVFSARGADLTGANIPLVTPPDGCAAVAAHINGLIRTESFLCEGQQVQVTTALLPHGTNPARILESAGGKAAAGLLGEVDSQVEQIGGGPWVVLSGRDLGGIAAYAAWIDGEQRIGGLHDRLKMARDMFTQGPPVITESVAIAPGKPGAEAVLRAFLEKPLQPNT
jgi:exosortase A